MSDRWPIFSHSIAFDPTGDIEALLKQAPPKPAVYLLAAEDDQPVQLLSVKHLRNSLKRRLGPSVDQEPSKRVDYHALVRRIFWRPVYSDFEADVIYLDAARLCFPATYRGMTGLSPAWFVHVNPEANFPRYTKTFDLSIKSGLLLGPMQDKHDAAALIEQLQDAFDLCRYYSILVQAPNGLACAYKEMGKCPAPCDGSISMAQYRRLIDWSAQTVIDPKPVVDDAMNRMKLAAGALRFESAGRIKLYVDLLGKIGQGKFRYVRRLRDFNYLSIQRGPRENTAKLFLITPTEVIDLAGWIGGVSNADYWVAKARETAALRQVDTIDSAAAERLSVVASHLFSGKAGKGVFVQLDEADEQALSKAFKEVQKAKPPEIEEQGEGVVKQLQML